ncbi:MAG: hypothetical protein AAGJ35_08500, partial [Myxococcota bacterium]
MKRWTVLVSCMGWMCILFCSGCLMSLKQMHVRELKVHGPDVFCPGQRFSIAVSAWTHKPKPLFTPGVGGGRVSWDNYRVAFTGGTVFASGVLVPAADPRETFNRRVQIRVRSPHHPELLG